MNDISITWSSDQRQLIADMQKRHSLMEKEISHLKLLSGNGKTAGTVMTGAYRDAGREIERLSKLADQGFQKMASPMEAHLSRLKELRALYRMGKIDIDQFNRASADSLKQRYAATGQLDRLRGGKRDKAEAEKAHQAEEAAAQKELQRESSRLGQIGEAFRKSATPMEAHLQRLKELRVAYRMGKIEIDQFNKAAVDSLKQRYAATGQLDRLRGGKRDKAEAEKAHQAEEAAAEESRRREREAQAQFYLKRRQMREAEAAAELVASAAAAKKETEARLAAAAKEREAMLQHHLAKKAAREKMAAEEAAANRQAADQVRRGMMSEAQLARVNFRERMRQLHDLRRANGLTQAEYSKAARQAYDEWKKVGGINLTSSWKGLPPIIAGAVTATAALTASVRLVRSEFEALKSAQSEAARTHMSYAAAQAEAISNLDDSMTPQQLNQSVKKLAADLNVSDTMVMNAVNESLGTKPASASPQDVLKAVGAAIPFNRFDQAGLNSSARGILLAMADDRNATPESILGQQQAAKLASPVTKSSNFSDYQVPYATSASAFKDKNGVADSARDSYALMAVLGSRMGDVEGRVTGSAFGDLRRDLDKRLDLKDVVAGQQGITLERLRRIAFDPKYKEVQQHLLGELVGGHLTTEARAHGPLTQIIQGDQKIWDEINRKHQEIPNADDQAVKFYRDKQQQLESMPEQATARAKMGLDAISERLQLSNQKGARASISRESLDKILESSGVGKTERSIQSARFEVASAGATEMSPQLAAQILKERSNQLDTVGERGLLDKVLEGVWGFQSGKTPVSTADDKENAANLRKAAELLEKLVAISGSQPSPIVNILMPGIGEKPGPPAAAGLQSPF